MADDSFRIQNVNHRWSGSGLRVCRDISLNIKKNSIHALIGENGAGKTTLGHIICGLQIPDTGTLTLGGKTIDLSQHTGGLIKGIGIIRQRSIWPTTLSVLEAAVLGRAKIPKKKSEQKNLFMETARHWNLEDVDPALMVSRLDAPTLQRAEMVASLMFEHQFLVLDEPATAWEEGRGQEFYSLMDRLKKSGCAVLLITHRLEDIFNIADEVTVMRHGRVGGHWDINDVKHAQLAECMFGEKGVNRKDLDHGRNERKTPEAESPVLELRKVELIIAGIRKLVDVNIALMSGEIMGITGLKEEGLRYLEEVVSGNRRPNGGALYVESKQIKRGPWGMRAANLRYVPSDRMGRGASLSSTMRENLLLLKTQAPTRGGWWYPKRMLGWFESGWKVGDDNRLDISGYTNQKLNELSGGNIQKVILRRELKSPTRLLLLSNPTWGLDERSRQLILRQIRQIRDKGTAVLLLSTDLDEVMELSDRVAVIRHGRLSAFRPASSWQRRELAHLIGGVE